MNRIIYLFGILFLLFSCNSSGDNANGDGENDSLSGAMGFVPVSAEHSGIQFINSIKETETFNYYLYEDIYSGGGVAIGDINNDNLPDIYFTGNQSGDHLYLNKGGLQFQDITKTAFKFDMAEGWHTGVNMVDINADGWLDIYVCRSGDITKRHLFSNLLFINNKDNTFSEQGATYGVDIARRTMNAAFFDYDNDNDLDLYVLNHPHQYEQKVFSRDELLKLKKEGEDADVFLENQDGKFVDVSKKAGIENNMFGLGIGISDLDGNGFQDIYVSNDYQDPDLLYMNNGDGTFSEEIKEKTQHVSNFSMGNDIADFNNDGFLDIVTLDMVSEDHVRSKKNMGGMSTANFWDIVNVGFHHQYMFNGLQLNNGNGTFSEIGQLAGISKTDWSWAPLLADFDNDGLKDLFITNGYRREVRDRDYNMEYDQKKANEEIQSFDKELELIPTTKIENYIFKNEGNLKFKKMTADWGLNIPINSNGAAYADLDNDGDLDLVLNNMEDKASLFENKLAGEKKRFLRVKIGGYGKNTQALGAKVTLHTSEGIQYQELQVSRGYISSVEGILHFGLGEAQVEKVTVQWPDGTILEKKSPQVNSTITLNYKEGKKGILPKKTEATLFRDITDSLLNFVHSEASFDDFKSEVLLPNKLSQSGPFIATGDVNGDGMEDLYITGPLGKSGKMYVQTAAGFKEQTGPWQKETKREEMDALFFDADGDKDLDLYVVSGGNEYFYDSPFLIDQLYLNDGKGNFTNKSEQLPQIPRGGQSVTAGDYDRDGDLDLFVGGRQIPGYYPYVPKSYLYQNNKGVFTDVTPQSPQLEGPGLVTDALFDDFDSDGDLDLVVVGEWMPVSFFENNKGIFTNVTDLYNSSKDVGWWYSIEKGDFNKDGRMDYVVGNLGENNKFHPSKETPLELYCHDFDENGTNDIVLGEYQNNICYPVRGRQCSSEQMPFIKDKFPTYSDFATADLSKIYGKEKLEKALHFSVTSFSSVVFMSQKEGYQINHLPVYCQFGPINQTIVQDFNKDGNLDAVVAGNNFGVEVETIRYDGGRGVVLLGDGKGNFKQLSPTESGFFENKDCKDMAMVQVKGKTILITVSNQAKAKTFLLKK